jgi:hypothetical protein
LNDDENNPECDGIDGVLEIYKKAIVIFIIILKLDRITFLYQLQRISKILSERESIIQKKDHPSLNFKLIPLPVTT